MRNHRTTKEIRTENAATVKPAETAVGRKIIEQSEEVLKALNRHSQRGTCPKTLLLEM